MTAPRIIIPHGLAADVLRVLRNGSAKNCTEVMDEIDALRGIDDETPGVGFAPVWVKLRELSHAGAVWLVPVTLGTLWRIRSEVMP